MAWPPAGTVASPSGVCQSARSFCCSVSRAPLEIDCLLGVDGDRDAHRLARQEAGSIAVGGRGEQRDGGLRLEGHLGRDLQGRQPRHHRAGGKAQAVAAIESVRQRQTPGTGHPGHHGSDRPWGQRQRGPHRLAEWIDVQGRQPGAEGQFGVVVIGQHRGQRDIAQRPGSTGARAQRDRRAGEQGIIRQFDGDPIEIGAALQEDLASGGQHHVRQSDIVPVVSITLGYQIDIIVRPERLVRPAPRGQRVLGLERVGRAVVAAQFPPGQADQQFAVRADIRHGVFVWRPGVVLLQHPVAHEYCPVRSDVDPRAGPRGWVEQQHLLVFRRQHVDFLVARAVVPHPVVGSHRDRLGTAVVDVAAVALEEAYRHITIRVAWPVDDVHTGREPAFRGVNAVIGAEADIHHPGRMIGQLPDRLAFGVIQEDQAIVEFIGGRIARAGAAVNGHRHRAVRIDSNTRRRPGIWAHVAVIEIAGFEMDRRGGERAGERAEQQQDEQKGWMQQRVAQQPSSGQGCIVGKFHRYAPVSTDLPSILVKRPKDDYFKKIPMISISTSYVPSRFRGTMCIFARMRALSITQSYRRVEINEGGKGVFTAESLLVASGSIIENRMLSTAHRYYCFALFPRTLRSPLPHIRLLH